MENADPTTFESQQSDAIDSLT